MKTPISFACIAVAAASLLSGCSYEERPYPQYPQTTYVQAAPPPPTYVQPVYVQPAPPPEPYEAHPPPPSPGYDWVKGHWRWTGASYAWVGGRWNAPPRPNARWYPGHWEHQNRGWLWVDGGWRL